MPPLDDDIINQDCPTGGNAIPGCTDVPEPPPSNIVDLAPGTYGKLDIRAGTTVNLYAGTYAVDSFASCATCTVNIVTGPVLLKVAGCSANDGTNCTSYLALPVDFGGGFSNPSLIASNFQIQYAGDPLCTDPPPGVLSKCNEIKLAGTGTPSAVVYAPRAYCNLTGGGNFYGALLCATVRNTGGTVIHYDRALKNWEFTVGNYMLSSFTWKKY